MNVNKWWFVLLLPGSRGLKEEARGEVCFRSNSRDSWTNQTIPACLNQRDLDQLAAQHSTHGTFQRFQRGQLEKWFIISPLYRVIVRAHSSILAGCSFYPFRSSCWATSAWRSSWRRLAHFFRSYRAKLWLEKWLIGFNKHQTRASTLEWEGKIAQLNQRRGSKAPRRNSCNHNNYRFRPNCLSRWWSAVWGPPNPLRDSGLRIGTGWCVNRSAKTVQQRVAQLILVVDSAFGIEKSNFDYIKDFFCKRLLKKAIWQRCMFSALKNSKITGQFL